MNSKFRFTPAMQFPEDLAVLGDQALHVLHSRLRRQIDAEYAVGDLSWDTEMRLDEVREELDRRESGAELGAQWRQGERRLHAS